MTDTEFRPARVCTLGLHLESDPDGAWAWCCKNLASGTWYVKFGITGRRCSYWFQHSQDLLVFRLTHGL